MSGSDLRGAADLEDKTFAQIFNRVNTAKFNTGVRVWFNADPGKVNGAPDFYRSLAQIGEPIDILDEGATRPITHQVQSIIQLGKDGASSTLALRMKNLEKFRLTEAGLFTELSDNFQIRTRTVSTGIPSQGSFETLDVPATVKANEDLNNDDGHIQKTLEEAMDRYRTRNPTIVEHFDAIHSARQAIGGCGCTLPNFALKKRSPGHFLA
jgi:hypothetical protein